MDTDEEKLFHIRAGSLEFCYFVVEQQGGGKLH